MIRLLLFVFIFTVSSAEMFDFKIIQRANRAYAEGNYAKSAVLFESLKDKNTPIVAYDKANALYNAKEYDAALNAYAKAKGVDEAQRLHNVGNSYFQKREFMRAIESYENALRLREDVDTRHNLELAKQKRKEEEEKKNDKKSNKKKQDKKKNEDKKRQSQQKKEHQMQKEQKKKNAKKQKKAKEDKKDQEKKMTPQEKKDEAMRKKELKHMMNQLSKKKMPTLMYQSRQNRGEEDAQNPW